MNSVRIAFLAALVLAAGCSSVRNVMISSDPTGAEIQVDGQTIGNAPMTHPLDFAASSKYRIVAKKEGFVENFAEVGEIFLDAQGNKVHLKIEEDEAFTGTTESEAVNTWVQVETNPSLEPDQAWQILIDTLTQYYPKLERFEKDSGYISSKVDTRTFRRGLENTKVSNQFLCAMETKNPLVYKVKVESKQLNRGKWEAFPRIFKNHAGLVDDLKARLSE